MSSLVERWRVLRRAYVAVAATRWGYNVLGRILPSAFFLLGFLGGLDPLMHWVAPPRDLTPAALLAFVQEIAARAFGLVQAGLFAVRKRPLGPPSSLVGALVALVATFYGAVLIFFDTLGLRRPDPHADPLLVTVTAWVAAAAFWLLVAGLLSLNRHIGVFPEVRGLVTRGPYAQLRHPMYAAYLLFALSTLLRTLSPASLVLFGVYYVLVAWRAALEERALERVFGEAYRVYLARAWGVVPEPLASWLRAHAPG